MQQDDTQQDGQPIDDPGHELPAPESDDALRHALDAKAMELDKLKAKLDEVMRAYSGLMNDQKDFRARLEREKQRVLETERGNLALPLLEAVDELDRALAAEKGDSGLARGVRMIRETLVKKLNAMGVERIPLAEKPYDPALAEAVDMVPTSDAAMNDVVIEEALPGYRLNGRVLRPGRVRVAKYVPSVKADSGAPRTPEA